MGCGKQSGVATRVIVFVGFAVIAASPAAAQLVPLPACTVLDKSRLVEWDVEIANDGAGSADTESGSLVVDRQSSRRSRVLFVTRVGASARLYRLTPGLNMKKDAAEAKSWDLGSFLTGGIRLRLSSDGPAFINTLLESGIEGGVVALDPNNNTRTIWPDRPLPDTLQTSDVAIDKRGSGFGVYTAAPKYNPVITGAAPLTGGVVQRLRPGKPGTTNPDGSVDVPADVTRWQVGFGAGTCDEVTRSPTQPCIPGVAVDRYGKVFVSEPDFVPTSGGKGAVGELDPTLGACPPTIAATQCSVVRHWPLPALTSGPRELMVDNDGVVWGITSSGEVFSLRIDRYSNKASVTRHDPIIGQGAEYMFALAPDGGAVGFTDSNVNKVSLLFPKNNAKPVVPDTKYVPAETGTIVGQRVKVLPSAHPVTPTIAKADTFVYTQPDGSYRETDIASGMTDRMALTGSLDPTGIAPDIARRTGSFYYGVGFRADGVSSHRVGQLLVNIEPERELRERRDDDDFDHDGVDNGHDDDDDDDGKPDMNDDDDDNDCIPDLMDHDKDNDGIDDDDDTNDRETVKKDSGTLAPGQIVRYDMETDANSLALIAVVEAADLTAPFVIDVVNPAGVVVLSVPSVGGKAIATTTPASAGYYTIQVRNTGLKSTTYTTKVIGRSIWF
jgi:hypothetical protein